MGTEETSRTFLRHTLATLSYRGGKAVRGAPAGFAVFSPGGGSRSAVAVLAHVGDLLDWALSIAKGERVWRESPPLDWEGEAARFHAACRALDDFLASGAPLAAPAEKLFQGPIADALTHVGQIALLRRLAGEPVKGENYYVADIATGRVGAEQAPPRREF